MFELIFDVDSLKKSTNVSATIFIGVKKWPVLSIGILKAEEHSYRVRLSMFAVLVLRNWLFPVHKAQYCLI